LQELAALQQQLADKQALLAQKNQELVGARQVRSLQAHCLTDRTLAVSPTIVAVSGLLSHR
jgi:hypothetical protein